MPLFDAIIIGGGIAGLATAASLRTQGVTNILILEKASALRNVGATIGLFPNGLAALDLISPPAFARVLSSAIPMTRSVMRDADGGAIITDRVIPPPSSATRPSHLYLVWYLLQRFLREAIVEETLWLGATAELVSEEEEGVRVEGSRRGEKFSVRGRVVIGADGIRSTVRQALWGECDMVYHGKMMLRSCVDLCELDDGMRPEAGVTTAFVGKEEGKLFAMRETSPGIVTVTAMAKFDEPSYAGDADARKARMRDMFGGYPEVVRHVVEQTPPDAFLENAVYDSAVVEEWAKGRVVLIGDAAHAMTPGLGQGANMGLEDAAELAASLVPLLRNRNVGGDELRRGLDRFWRARRERVSAVHAASRARTAAVNKSPKETRTDFAPSEQQQENFRIMLYGWKPLKELAHT